MNRFAAKCKAMVYISIALSLFILTACEGTETRGKVDRTVETLSGKDHVQQMKEMKSDIDKINKIQTDRLKQTE